MTIKYIFFDCFNTLIDDFDETGDESGMKPLAHIPVKHGLYAHASHFYDDYIFWRQRYWSNGNHNEVLLSDRLHQIFTDSLKKSGKMLDVTPAVDEMLSVFHHVFPDTVRKSSEINLVLDRLRNRIPMAVVSNFFLPGYPEQMLKNNQLNHYFDFILDSAQMMYKKPGKEIYWEAIQRAGIPDKELHKVLFVGDNLRNDVLTPREMGMQAWYFDRSDVRPGLPTPPGIKSFKNWSEFSEMIWEVV